MTVMSSLTNSFMVAAPGFVLILKINALMILKGEKYRYKSKYITATGS